MSKKEIKVTRANSNDDRAPRDSESRAKQERPKAWKMPSALELPEEAIEIAKSQGIVYRWVRESIAGQDDKTKVSKRFREGFEPVRPEELPGFHDLPTVDDGRHAGIIGVGGLVLARIPVEMADQRNKHYQGVSQNQLDAVDRDWMRENNPIMPKLAPQRKSSVSFGSGRKGG